MNTAFKTNTISQQPPRDLQIRVAQTAVIDRMQKDLTAACSTIVAKGRVDDGLTCHVTQGKFSATVDMGLGMGGDAAGPSPGFYGRTAVVGCVAIGVKMLAAREGIVFRSLEVTVEMDFDDASLMGLSARTAAPYETRVRIDIDTDEQPSIVRDLVDRALAMDPWFLALRDAQVVQSTVNLSSEVVDDIPAA